MTKATRRRKGEGSISISRDKQTIEVKITLPGGKRRKKTVRRLKGECAAAHSKRADVVLADLLAELEAGRSTPGSHTVTTYADLWLDAIAGSVADSTHAGYGRIIAHYIKPYIGARRIAALTIEDVEQLDDTLRRRGLSHATRRHARHRLASLLRHARKHGHLAVVVTDLADPVKGVHRDEAKAASRKRADMALDPEQLGRVLDAAKGDRLEALVALIVYTGVRRGEALGLGWDAVDLEAGTFEIRRAMSTVDAPDAPTRYVLSEPKTAGSWRTIDMPPFLLTTLRSWRARQGQERLALGADYSGTMSDDNDQQVPLVFTDELGRCLEPDDLRRLFARLGKTAGLEHVHPHQFRHSVASVRIAAGEDHALVGDQLGHANPSVTLGIYAHSFAAARKRAASTVADAISAAGGSSR